MLRYFYAWTPFVIVAAVVLLTLPWLGLFALVFFALVAVVALGALAGAIVAAPYLLIRSIGRRRHGLNVARQPIPTLSLAERDRAWLEVFERGGGTRWSRSDKDTVARGFVSST